MTSLSPGLPSAAAQKLKVLELYCGAGGLSFIDRATDSVDIETCWAVDLNEQMCDAFRANYPDAQARAPAPPARHAASQHG